MFSQKLYDWDMVQNKSINYALPGIDNHFVTVCAGKIVLSLFHNAYCLRMAITSFWCIQWNKYVPGF